jgi:hypothetical protein
MVGCGGSSRNLSAPHPVGGFCCSDSDCTATAYDAYLELTLALESSLFVYNSYFIKSESTRSSRSSWRCPVFTLDQEVALEAQIQKLKGYQPRFGITELPCPTSCTLLLLGLTSSHRTDLRTLCGSDVASITHSSYPGLSLPNCSRATKICLCSRSARHLTRNGNSTAEKSTMEKLQYKTELAFNMQKKVKRGASSTMKPSLSAMVPSMIKRAGKKSEEWALLV